MIKTFIPIDAAAATEVNRPQYRFVSKAQVTAGQTRPSADELKAAAEAAAEADAKRADAKRAAARAAAAGAPWQEVSRKAHNHAARDAANQEPEEV